MLSFSTSNTQLFNFHQSNLSHTFTQLHHQTVKTKCVISVQRVHQGKKNAFHADKIIMNTKMVAFKAVLQDIHHISSQWLASSAPLAALLVLVFIGTIVSNVKIQLLFLKTDCVLKPVLQDIQIKDTVSVIMSVMIKGVDCVVALDFVINAYLHTMENQLANGSNFFLHFLWFSLSYRLPCMLLYLQELYLSSRASSLWHTKSFFHSLYSNSWHGFFWCPRFTQSKKLYFSFQW